MKRLELRFLDPPQDSSGEAEEIAPGADTAAKDTDTAEPSSSVKEKVVEMEQDESAGESLGSSEPLFSTGDEAQETEREGANNQMDTTSPDSDDVFHDSNANVCAEVSVGTRQDADQSFTSGDMFEPAEDQMEYPPRSLNEHILREDDEELDYEESSESVIKYEAKAIVTFTKVVEDTTVERRATKSPSKVPTPSPERRSSPRRAASREKSPAFGARVSPEKTVSPLKKRMSPEKTVSPLKKRMSPEKTVSPLKKRMSPEKTVSPLKKRMSPEKTPVQKDLSPKGTQKSHSSVTHVMEESLEILQVTDTLISQVENESTDILQFQSTSTTSTVKVELDDSWNRTAPPMDDTEDDASFLNQAVLLDDSSDVKEEVSENVEAEMSLMADTSASCLFPHDEERKEEKKERGNTRGPSANREVLKPEEKVIDQEDEKEDTVTVDIKTGKKKERKTKTATRRKKRVKQASADESASESDTSSVLSAPSIVPKRVTTRSRSRKLSASEDDEEPSPPGRRRRSERGKSEESQSEDVSPAGSEQSVKGTRKKPRKPRGKTPILETVDPLPALDENMEMSECNYLFSIELSRFKGFGVHTEQKLLVYWIIQSICGLVIDSMSAREELILSFF